MKNPPKIAFFTLLLFLISAEAPASLDCPEATAPHGDRLFLLFRNIPAHQHGPFTQPTPSNHGNASNLLNCHDDFLNPRETPNGADYIDYVSGFADFIYPAADVISSLAFRLTRSAFHLNSNGYHLSRYEKIEQAWEVYNYAMLTLFGLKTLAYPMAVIEGETISFMDLFQQMDAFSTLNSINTYVNERRDAACGTLQFLYHVMPWGQKWNAYIQEQLFYQSTDFLVFINFFINFHTADIHSIYQPINTLDDLFSLLAPNNMLASVSRASFRLLTLAPGLLFDLEKSPLFPGMYTLFSTLPLLYSITQLTLKSTSVPFGSAAPFLSEIMTLMVGSALKMNSYILGSQALLFMLGQQLDDTTCRI